MPEHLTRDEERLVRTALTRANGQAWGIAFGALCGLTLFAATVVLVIRGGPNPGPHLGLLGVYFPGYHVTWAGSIVGLGYASVTGYLIGRTVAAIYNRLL
jgi:hypothetical protein